MAKISLRTITGMTASDGSEILSGATVKFDTILHPNGIVEILPRIYRSETAFASGYTFILMRDEDFPSTLVIANLNPDLMYTVTMTQLYNAARNYLNDFLGGTYLAVFIE